MHGVFAFVLNSSRNSRNELVLMDLGFVSTAVTLPYTSIALTTATASNEILLRAINGEISPFFAQTLIEVCYDENTASSAK